MKRRFAATKRRFVFLNRRFIFAKRRVGECHLEQRLQNRLSIWTSVTGYSTSKLWKRDCSPPKGQKPKLAQERRFCPFEIIKQVLQFGNGDKTKRGKPFGLPLVTTAGFKPATSWAVIRDSIQLSYVALIAFATAKVRLFLKPAKKMSFFFVFFVCFGSLMLLFALHRPLCAGVQPPFQIPFRSELCRFGSL